MHRPFKAVGQYSRILPHQRQIYCRVIHIGFLIAPAPVAVNVAEVEMAVNEFFLIGKDIFRRGQKFIAQFIEVAHRIGVSFFGDHTQRQHQEVGCHHILHIGDRRSPVAVLHSTVAVRRVDKFPAEVHQSAEHQGLEVAAPQIAGEFAFGIHRQFDRVAQTAFAHQQRPAIGGNLRKTAVRRQQKTLIGMRIVLQIAVRFAALFGIHDQSRFPDRRRFERHIKYIAENLNGIVVVIKAQMQTVHRQRFFFVIKEQSLPHFVAEKRTAVDGFAQQFPAVEAFAVAADNIE